jgi:hypothetical protein
VPIRPLRTVTVRAPLLHEGPMEMAVPRAPVWPTAQVFLVRHLERDKLYAMKVYRKKMVVQRNYTRYSLSERRVMSPQP